MFDKRRPFHPFFLAIGAGLAAASGAAFAQETIPPEMHKDCLTVELIMYSGRPRPKYLICDEAEKKSILEKMKGKRAVKPEDVAYPEMESSPTYQGLLLTLPAKPGEKAERLVLRKGFVKSDRTSKISVDKDAELEILLLNRSLQEKDHSRSPTEGKEIGEVSGDILKKVKAENGLK